MRATAGGHGLALLYINLDRFKTINDSLGDSAGDQLLRHVAQRIEGCVSARDTVARLGSDEFAVLLADATVHTASAVAGRIITTLAASLDMAGTVVVPQASVGISVHPLDGRDADSLMRNADAAMHRAKKQGGNRAVFYEESMNQQARRRLLVESALRRALDRNELRLHYQPKVFSQDGGWEGVEALMRWQDPELGVVSPVEFIPIAEDCGLIHALGATAIRQAALFARQCHASGVPIGHVAVNVSMLQLRDASFAQYIEATLRELVLPPALLQLEITESSVMEETGNVVALLRRIRDLGVKIAMDDFGTGHSSLATLQNLPVDIVKIDRAFIRRIAVEPAALALVRAMIAVAHALDLTVVAEGVENEDQAGALRREGCDISQGYLYSAAVCPADICKMAATWELQRTGQRVRGGAL